MKKIILSAIFLMALVACQEELLVKGDYPIEPITKSGEEPSDGKEPAISKWDALKIVEPITSKYPDRTVFISDQLIPADTEIAYNMLGHVMDIDDLSYYKTPEFDSWLILIEGDESIMGEQPILHLFVDAQTGQYTEVELRGKAIVGWDTSRETNTVSKDEIRITDFTSRTAPERSSGPAKFAVLLSGGTDKYNNTSCFYYDIKRMYNVLIDSLGYSKSGIFVLMSDGTDPAADRKTGPYSYDSSPWDLDGDGDGDIDFEAKKSRLTNIFNVLQLWVQDGDEVLVYISDIGHSGGYINLWDGDTLDPSELNFLLNKLGAYGSSVKVDVVLGPSYSGSFIADISANNRTITTSSAYNETAHRNTYNYTYFLKYWTDALVLNSDGNTTDIYNDAYASPYELYSSANKIIRTSYANEHPQYDSTPSDFGEMHSLDGEVIPFLTGSDYLSTINTCSYTVTNCPTPCLIGWYTGTNVAQVSSADSTIVVRGSGLASTEYYYPDTFVSANIIYKGKMHNITKRITSVWKPGAYIGQHYITGSNGDYHLLHYPQVGTYPGTTGYQWFTNNSAWQIINQNGGSVYLYEGTTSGHVDLSVVFEDPFGGTIYVSDQVH